ncbi:MULTISPECIES: Flp family type IVb pilin [Raoultella]|jgi:pilus assembly protein Flp/PilA|uniref:Flp family type IVb pilin n=1 Tax=Raoultella planticola TaxID=575 RepID=A0A443VDN3_RAOPL|nr:Flp family type IVb pilin [Raoultella planticola]EJR0220674.1 Flp family type IVb pilin [Raoultella planticola]EJR0350488.1 Flp family type IVb pilin [Raoultella planticola]EKW3528829.1 Flp family type IVb pilin [Raoultella planticola]ELC3571863.1 Flp family type IVb pilin [Raoultella planticola]ELF4971465.1 Flp family type IVb pilin [Raoultella planticola]
MLNRVYDKYLAAYTCVAGRIHDFKRNEKGVTAVEYAIVIAGVAAVVAVIFGEDGTVSDLLTGIFSKIETSVNGSMGIGGTPAP